MSLRRYADGLIAKSCKMQDVYDDGVENNVLIEKASRSTRHSLQNYWATVPQANLADIAVQAKSLSVI